MCIAVGRFKNHCSFSSKRSENRGGGGILQYLYYVFIMTEKQLRHLWAALKLVCGPLGGNGAARCDSVASWETEASQAGCTQEAKQTKGSHRLKEQETRRWTSASRWLAGPWSQADKSPANLFITSNCVHWSVLCSETKQKYSQIHKPASRCIC